MKKYGISELANKNGVRFDMEHQGILGDTTYIILAHTEVTKVINSKGDVISFQVGEVEESSTQVLYGEKCVTVILNNRFVGECIKENLSNQQAYDYALCEAKVKMFESHLLKLKNKFNI